MQDMFAVNVVFLVLTWESGTDAI